MKPHDRLILKLNMLRYHLPYGSQSMMDECIAMVHCMRDEALAQFRPSLKDEVPHNVD
jgi:hypothetical protein